MSGYVSPFHVDRDEADYLRPAGFASIAEQKAHAAQLADERSAKQREIEAIGAFLSDPEPVCSAIRAIVKEPARIALVNAVLAAAAAEKLTVDGVRAVKRHIQVAEFCAVSTDKSAIENYARQYLPAAEPDRAAILAHAAKLSPAKRARYLASKGMKS